MHMQSILNMSFGFCTLSYNQKNVFLSLFLTHFFLQVSRQVLQQINEEILQRAVGGMKEQGRPYKGDLCLLVFYMYEIKHKS